MPFANHPEERGILNVRRTRANMFSPGLARNPELHDTLNTGMVRRAKPVQKQPLVIAIGGATGNIGKSLFTASLAVHLAEEGRRTVAVDLDLDCERALIDLAIEDSLVDLS